MKNKLAAVIHQHFHIMARGAGKSGPLTVQDQIETLERFILYHTRQAEVGKLMLGQILVKEQAEEAAAG
jgi:hypothetical protein